MRELDFLPTLMGYKESWAVIALVLFVFFSIAFITTAAGLVVFAVKFLGSLFSRLSSQCHETTLEVNSQNQESWEKIYTLHKADIAQISQRYESELKRWTDEYFEEFRRYAESTNKILGGISSGLKATTYSVAKLDTRVDLLAERNHDLALSVESMELRVAHMDPIITKKETRG